MSDLTLPLAPQNIVTPLLAPLYVAWIISITLSPVLLREFYVYYGLNRRAPNLEKLAVYFQAIFIVVIYALSAEVSHRGLAPSELMPGASLSSTMVSHRPEIF